MDLKEIGVLVFYFFFFFFADASVLFQHCFLAAPGSPARSLLSWLYCHRCRCCGLPRLRLGAGCAVLAAPALPRAGRAPFGAPEPARAAGRAGCCLCANRAAEVQLPPFTNPDLLERNFWREIWIVPWVCREGVFLQEKPQCSPAASFRRWHLPQLSPLLPGKVFACCASAAPPPRSSSGLP